RGASILTGCEVDRIETRSGGVVVGAGERTIAARALVNAAGLHADRVAAMSGVDPPVRIVPFRGEYHVLSEQAAGLVGGLIYPVPDPRFPFLGVHFTRRIDGSVEVGPNAVLALGREHYRGTRADWSGLTEVLGYRGFRRLAARHAVPGLGEMLRSRSRALYAREARRLVPAIRSGDLDRGGSGIRAQAVFPNGQLADDFVIAGEGPLIHVLSAPSPAATAALVIGEHLAGLVILRLDGGSD
ncbi:MAG: FAD-dependent oxidoreductase, partial [Actinomycetota bacterium]